MTVYKSNISRSLRHRKAVHSTNTWPIVHTVNATGQLQKAEEKFHAILEHKNVIKTLSLSSLDIIIIVINFVTNIFFQMSWTFFHKNRYEFHCYTSANFRRKWTKDKNGRNILHWLQKNTTSSNGSSTFYWYSFHRSGLSTLVKQNNNYTVNHKKRDILFLTITLAKLNRFL